MSDKMKLTPEDKLELLLHLLSIVDEQNVITFADDKFDFYFKSFSKPLVEGYLMELNNKKTIQFMVYGEPGMLNEHFIKISDHSKLAREIKLQIDMVKAKHKDMILIVAEENKTLKSTLEDNTASKEGRLPKKEMDAKDIAREQELLSISAKVDDALSYSKSLKKSLKQNKNLQILENVVQETEGYLRAVKIISTDHDALNMTLIDPIIEENRKIMKRLSLTASAAVVSITLFGILLLTVLS